MSHAGSIYPAFSISDHPFDREDPTGDTISSRRQYRNVLCRSAGIPVQLHRGRSPPLGIPPIDRVPVYDMDHSVKSLAMVGPFALSRWYPCNVIGRVQLQRITGAPGPPSQSDDRIVLRPGSKGIVGGMKDI